MYKGLVATDSGSRFGNISCSQAIMHWSNYSVWMVNVTVPLTACVHAFTLSTQHGNLSN